MIDIEVELATTVYFYLLQDSSN